VERVSVSPLQVGPKRISEEVMRPLRAIARSDSYKPVVNAEYLVKGKYPDGCYYYDQSSAPPTSPSLPDCTAGGKEGLH
jgi:hypothetical protein